ncbi:MAG: hypothetical protein OWR52_00055 [Acidibacillus sp.]|uniref:Lipoprotein n=1 Tax=Sulfoacidibacillus ferrooxidans TaxID=2005001 RepID=A0A9X1VE45_9BACL|nr:hypothetical protein [Sulfoacidibacillus ferrooxidans]MCI0184372.1 hypothetical protein [Sulfoacidibacillus ferrooxidans]MCY0891907.1 hypothetical protein [Acidibacillus sp.]
MRLRGIAMLGVVFLSLATVLTGCGTTRLNNNSTARTTNKTAIHTSKQASNQTGTISNLKFADMTAQQIANYDLHQGGPPPFSGTNVKRNTLQGTPDSVPNGAKIQGSNKTFNANDYMIIDSWSGLLKNNEFVFHVYRNTSSKQIYISSSYKSRLPVVFSLDSKKMIIKNFTGAFVVMGVPGQGGPFYALNLITGKLLNPHIDSQKYSHITSQMSGCYPCVGAYGPNYITGLQQNYPFKNQ